MASHQCGYVSEFEDWMGEKMPCGMYGRHTARGSAGMASYSKVGSNDDVASLDGSRAITWLVVGQVMMESLEQMRYVLVDMAFRRM
jgi:hypothetical protein